MPQVIATPECRLNAARHPLTAVSLICLASARLLDGDHRKLSGDKTMASWIKCTTTDGTEVGLNLDDVAMIRPHHRDRGGTGNEIIFASETLSSILVKDNPEYLAKPPRIQRGARRDLALKAS